MADVALCAGTVNGLALLRMGFELGDKARRTGARWRREVTPALEVCSSSYMLETTTGVKLV